MRNVDVGWIDIPEERTYPIDGGKIERLRDYKKMSRQKLAGKVGVTKRQIENYENGVTKSVYKKTLIKLSEALDVEPNELVIQSSGSTIERYRPRAIGVLKESQPSEYFDVTLKVAGTGSLVDIFSFLTEMNIFSTKVVNSYNFKLFGVGSQVTVHNKSIIRFVITGVLENGNFITIKADIYIKMYSLLFAAVTGTCSFDPHENLKHLETNKVGNGYIYGEVVESVETIEPIANGEMLEGDEWRQFFLRICVDSFVNALPISRVVKGSTTFLWDDMF